MVPAVGLPDAARSSGNSNASVILLRCAAGCSEGIRLKAYCCHTSPSTCNISPCALITNSACLPVCWQVWRTLRNHGLRSTLTGASATITSYGTQRSSLLRVACWRAFRCRARSRRLRGYPSSRIMTPQPTRSAPARLVIAIQLKRSKGFTVGCACRRQRIAAQSSQPFDVDDPLHLCRVMRQQHGAGHSRIHHLGFRSCCDSWWSFRRQGGISHPHLPDRHTPNVACASPSAAGAAGVSGRAADGETGTSTLASSAMPAISPDLTLLAQATISLSTSYALSGALSSYAQKTYHLRQTIACCNQWGDPQRARRLYRVLLENCSSVIRYGAREMSRFRVFRRYWLSPKPAAQSAWRCAYHRCRHGRRRSWKSAQRIAPRCPALHR